ncbi:pentapeptide repeat protein [Herbihabitans rhizosphaerae]|uniref:Pentapeptide repeat protein n=1 Tax=Herbihabitans rhizosphaerae TaxID=1872711 RepID=A0A4Q7KHV0_9PSEU|nr:pentapeptide repeat-containing protein [Herbihabitans rhizosphaerae]RZS34478.1 pentapeptide repeat protein [Herbihabitans rhizosphaerae]
MLSVRAMVLTGVLLAAIAVLSVVVLLWQLGSGTPGDATRLDVIRTAASIVLGTGGAAALVLAARRQRSTELDLVQRERVAEANERDAEERRVTDLYTHAVDQLGSDKAPVRHGGLHALERLAQNYPAHRQTIVNVLCAYLRMPFDDDEQEMQVRQTAQGILTRHLRYQYHDVDQDEPLASFWPDIDLRLSKARLVDWKLTGGRVRSANFEKCVFSGDTRFDKTTFTKTAVFRFVRFEDPVSFDRARFRVVAPFHHAEFVDHVGFAGVTFGGAAGFDRVTFAGAVDFDGAEFAERPIFDQSQARMDTTFAKSRRWPTGYDVAESVTVDEDQLDGRPGDWAYVRRLPSGAEG